MAKLPAYGRDLLDARRSGLAPIAHPWRPEGSPGWVLVTDSWVLAKFQREQGRTAVVIEAARTYDWDMVRELEVFVLTRAPCPELIRELRSARASLVLSLGSTPERVSDLEDEVRELLLLPKAA